MLLPGNPVQIDKPGGLSVDLNGNVLFADTGNHLVRAYVPNSGHVIDDLGGVVSSSGVPQGDDNGDRVANRTELNSPGGRDRNKRRATGGCRHRQQAPAATQPEPAPGR
jgi:hypothetical protein